MISLMHYNHPSFELLKCLNSKQLTNRKVIFDKGDKIDNQSESTPLIKEGEDKFDDEAKGEYIDVIETTSQEDITYNPKEVATTREVTTKEVVADPT